VVIDQSHSIKHGSFFIYLFIFFFVKSNSFPFLLRLCFDLIHFSLFICCCCFFFFSNERTGGDEWVDNFLKFTGPDGMNWLEQFENFDLGKEDVESLVEEFDQFGGFEVQNLFFFFSVSSSCSIFLFFLSHQTLLNCVSFIFLF